MSEPGSLSAAPSAVGLVLARPVRLLGLEPFFMEFIAGLEETMAERDLSILLQVVPEQEAEVETYRRWAKRRSVDAVIVVNLVVDLVTYSRMFATDLGGPVNKVAYTFAAAGLTTAMKPARFGNAFSSMVTQRASS